MQTDSESNRNTQAAALRSQIESLAAQSRSREADTLKAVIAYTSAGLHKACDGFSGIRDWIMECFDFNAACAGQMASIARLAPRFAHLTEAALSGGARIDAIAYAVRRLEREGLSVYSRVPYPEGPVESPFDPDILCATPEELIREFCIHSARSELTEHFDRICAELFDQQALLDEMSRQSLAWLEVNERPDGMWDLDGRLTADTGKLLSNALRTAVAPPRQEDADADGVLPPAGNRNAEALHQMVAAYGTDPDAPKRHGHTATLNLTCDLATLRGEETGRTPMLDGRPISLAKARHLACEAGIIPSIFDYTTGEALELGRAKRLPNTALRHKLELEQPTGCAWSGCRAPVSWTEAHHVEHWANGGPTVAENLILLCRFHHGRIHTDAWSIEKTGPGRATIVHTGNGLSDAEWEAEKDLPNGLDTSEWSPKFRRELTDLASWYAQQTMKSSIERARKRFRKTEEASSEPALVGASSRAASDPGGASREDPGGPPFLGGPRRATAEGAQVDHLAKPDPARERAPWHVRTRFTPHSGASPSERSDQQGSPSSPPALTPGQAGQAAAVPGLSSFFLSVAAVLGTRPPQSEAREPTPSHSHLSVAAILNAGPYGPESRSPDPDLGPPRSRRRFDRRGLQRG
ncbi:HNH endonuclease signature motif containing protein [Glycomyces paridis]|uniref:DUF222 domain-containing protein n=1 Tax=Glycomyces paridis TaxID=2126555 RepID=A0A4S8PBF7_9ACTN|nr:HNH endonuclease signature motif containing protein [Glycomyces paridis]THV27633.1 DUF222 domain-containing protein [Glycomyces paridis]